jgi:NAD(P)-dependent dehydrogenase (short-subunit alcohol dehydrogenase family)
MRIVVGTLKYCVEVSVNALFKPGQTAVVTGAALGIGRAVAHKLAKLGLRVVMVDQASAALHDSAAAVAAVAGADNVLTSTTDVADAAAMAALAVEVEHLFGAPTLLMNNAATRVGGGVTAPTENWRTAFEVNFWGVLNGVNAFLPMMLAAQNASYIVNVGSKQGITNPPGNAAYNATKAALRFYTESLQHDLRERPGCSVTAHLLVPGWTTTGTNTHKPGAWLPEQVIERMLQRLAVGSFYIVCPDNEVSEAMDRQRILWAATDITNDRPPLSRWHGGHGTEFEVFKM